MSWSLQMYSADGATLLATYTDTTANNPIVDGFQWTRDGSGMGKQLIFDAIGTELTFQPRSWVKLIVDGAYRYGGVLWRVPTNPREPRTVCVESFRMLFGKIKVIWQGGTIAQAYTTAKLYIPSSVSRPNSLPTTSANFLLKAGSYNLDRFLDEIGIAINYQWRVLAGASFAFSWISANTSQTFTADEVIYDDISWDDYVSRGKVDVKMTSLNIPLSEQNSEAKSYEGLIHSWFNGTGAGITTTIDEIELDMGGNTIYPLAYDYFNGGSWTNGISANALKDFNLGTGVNLGAGQKIRIGPTAANRIIVGARFWTNTNGLRLTREPTDASLSKNHIQITSGGGLAHFALPVLGYLSTAMQIVFEAISYSAITEVLLVELPTSYFNGKINAYITANNSTFSIKVIHDAWLAPTPRATVGTFSGVAPLWRYSAGLGDKARMEVEIGQLAIGRDSEAIKRRIKQGRGAWL